VAVGTRFGTVQHDLRERLARQEFELLTRDFDDVALAQDTRVVADGSTIDPRSAAPVDMGDEESVRPPRNDR
jgi:hypothetical protein